VSTTGSVGVLDAAALGPGNTTLPGTTAWIGSPGIGSLLVDAGSFLQLARLSFGLSGTGDGSGLITGAGTRVELVGNGATEHQIQRLMVGDWGVGRLTVNQGALLSTRTNANACLLPFHYCDTFVGGAAGDTAVLNIDGTGTQVLIGKNLFVAHPGIFVNNNAQVTYGQAGGTTRGTVNVTGGALLSTDRATVATDHWSTHATGQERNIGEVNVSGAGSRWVVTGGKVVDFVSGAVIEGDAHVATANHRNALAIINITNGGKMEVQGLQGHANGAGMNLTSGSGGGRTDMLVRGAGSTLSFTGDAGYLQVGRRQGSALLSILDGGSATGVQYVSVGRDGSFGEIMLDGLGSLLSVTGTVSPESRGGGATIPFVANMEIGRNGTGAVTVRNGARLEVKVKVAGDSGALMTLGRNAASSGRLTITGQGSTVLLSSQSLVPGGGPTEAFNPFMRVGRDGSGELNITQGGKLWLDGQAISTVTDSRFTSLYIGGNGSTTPGGKGIATVSGMGSEIKLTGSDTNIAVGWGPAAVGQLSVSDQGKISATGMSVGGAGSTGVLKLDNSRLEFAGQFTGGIVTGAFLAIGNGGGIGVANMANGSVVNISNQGLDGAGVYLGGTGNYPGGDGSLTMTGGSQINIQAAPGLGQLRIGRDGSALVRMRGASSIDVGDGQVLVARDKGSDGTLLISENSSLTAGWVGVGRNKTANGDVDGGTGTVVLINSTLTAPTIVVGTNGFLGGSGTIVGNVTNYGIFAPGNSPGTLEIDGSFTALAGSKMILEIESNGFGGFLTDLVIFKGGQPLDLANLNAEFRFLGTTDPNAFATSGKFTLDTFFQERQGDDSLAALTPTLFDNAVFTAQADNYRITSFAFDAATGGTVIAAAVPEPESWALMLAGLLTIAGIARRRARPQSR